jgi:quinol monooxygenase YgiN
VTIRHVILWTLHDRADAARFKAEMDSCKGLVPGMLQFDVVLAHEGLEANCDLMLDSTFADRAALEAYREHPHHLAVVQRIAPLRRTRHVLDYDTDQLKETPR